MLTVYLIVAFFDFFILSLAWNKENALNLTLKICFALMAVWSFILVLMQLGFGFQGIHV